MGDKLMSFGEHLEELRTRLKYSIYAIIVCMIVAYSFSDFLFALLAQPLVQAWQNAKLGTPQLHFANPIEPFFVFLKLSLVAGVFLAAPVVFYQLWRFVAPGLYRHERRYALPFAIASAVFFLGGAAFGYFVAFPFGFRFFLSYAQKNLGVMEGLLGKKVGISVANPLKLTPTLMMEEYFGLAWRLLLAFGIVFELPLLIFFLSIAGVVDYRTLWRYNRHFIVIAFVIGAILTPPDIITQISMSVPLVVLYNLSILLSFLVARKRKRRAQNAGAAG